MTPHRGRLACLFVPLFPLAARLRSEPSLRDEAIAVVEGNGHAARVVAATRKARTAGIQAGMTLPQARALLPRLLARGRDPESERAAQEALLDAAGLFSPRVEDAGEGVAFLDIDGLERLFTGHQATAERDVGRALLSAAGKEALPARAGIASSKLAARVAAALPDTPTVVPPGEEARFLAPLPLERLSPELALAGALARWGIRSVGDLARLPAGEVASRLGEAGLHLHETARGLDPCPLVPRPPAASFSEGMALEWPLTTLEPFLAMAEGALERLTRRLASEGLGCLRLDLELRLEPEGHDVRSISLPAPTREVKTLKTLVQLDLERRLPGAPVTGFTFTLHPDRPRRGQLTLFGPPEISPDRLATTLARLLALLGDGRAGSPRPVDGHRPGAYALAPYDPPAAPLLAARTNLTGQTHRNGRGLLTVRVLRPPVELEVLTEEDGDAAGPARQILTLVEPETVDTDRADTTERTPPDDGGGAHVRLLTLRTISPTSPPAAEASGRENGKVPRHIQGQVRVAAGPWHLEEGWWSDDPVSRDYWDVELHGGGLYRVFRERGTERWFADGIYD